MAAPVTLQQLRSDTLLFAADGGQQASIDEGFLDRLINQRLAMLYDKLVEASGETYYQSFALVNIVSGSETSAMPDGWYRLHSVVLEWSAEDFEEVPMLHNQGDRVHYASAEWAAHTPKAYYTYGGTQIRWLPVPRITQQARVWYVPICPTLTEDFQTFDGVNGWDRAVSIGAAIDVLTVQRLPSSHLLPLYQEQLERIEHMATERNMTQAHQVRDMFPEERIRAWWPRSRA